MTECVPAPGKPVGERVSDLEVTVKWLTDEMGLLSERLTQATGIEAILRRARAQPGA